MLRFTAHQMADISAATVSSGLARHWREVFPWRVLDQPGMPATALARACMAEARQSGIDSREDVAVFGDLCLAAGTGFASTMGGPRALR